VTTPSSKGSVTTGWFVCLRRFADAREESDETGAILILAIAFLLVVSLIVTGLANWTTDNLDNTLQFQSAGSKLYAAEGATQVALRAARYTFPTNTLSTGYLCPGETTPLVSVNGIYVQDWCVTVIPPVNLGGVTVSREVTLTACELPTATSALTGACTVGGKPVPILLTAVVDFDDVNANHVAICTATDQTTCGYLMTIKSWIDQ
jgi:hypothetical protein